MNRATLLLAVFAIAAAGAAASAAPRLKVVMKTWKVDAATAQQMLAGGAYDEAEMRRILTAYASDAADFHARLTGASAEAKEASARFAKFAADAGAALAVAGARDSVKARFSALREECRSCHDALGV